MLVNYTKLVASEIRVLINKDAAEEDSIYENAYAFKCLETISMILDTKSKICTARGCSFIKLRNQSTAIKSLIKLYRHRDRERKTLDIILLKSVSKDRILNSIKATSNGRSEYLSLINEMIEGIIGDVLSCLNSVLKIIKNI
jgi:hypothetical protein